MSTLDTEAADSSPKTKIIEEYLLALQAVTNFDFSWLVIVSVFSGSARFYEHESKRFHGIDGHDYTIN